MKKYILSIDQGTTSSRAIIFDHDNPIAVAQKEITCIFPKSGWVEVDPNEIWSSVVSVISEVLIRANIRLDQIDSIGITNQRETTIVWDKLTGLPVYNAIVWQSRQSEEICDRYLNKKEYIHEKTGLLIDPYFSATKIRFILENIENGQARAEHGELYFGTVDSWLICKLTNGEVHATDVSNASRTMLFNINTLSWDEELCDLFNIPMNMLPTVNDSSYNYGKASFFNQSVCITGVCGDQQASLFGQTCFDKGDCKNTYGTGCFLLLNVGNTIPLSKNGLLTTVAWKIGNDVKYALEGSVFIGGAVVQWLRDKLEFIKSSKESEECAKKSKDDGDVYFVPSFVGLATPYWDDNARGAIFGLTRASDKNDITKAAVDSIAYQCKDVFDVMREETNISLSFLNVDGGACANNYLVQFQSDILQMQINLPKCLETTALGVSYLAGLNTGYYKSLEEIKKTHCISKTFQPIMDKEKVDKLYKGWQAAVKATQAFKK